MPPNTPIGNPRLTEAPTINSSRRACECISGGILNTRSTDELSSAVNTMLTMPTLA